MRISYFRTFIFFVLYICAAENSLAQEEKHSIGVLLYDIGETSFATDILKNENTKRSNNLYFSLLVSGRLGEVKLKDAINFFKDRYSENNYFYSENKAVILFLQDERKKAIDTLKNHNLLLTTQAKLWLAKEHIDGEYANQDFKVAYDYLDNVNYLYIWQSNYIRAKLILEKKVPYKADNAIAPLLKAYNYSSYGDPVFGIATDTPTLALINIAQDGILMPRDSALTCGIRSVTISLGRSHNRQVPRLSRTDLPFNKKPQGILLNSATQTNFYKHETYS